MAATVYMNDWLITESHVYAVYEARGFVLAPAHVAAHAAREHWQIYARDTAADDFRTLLRDDADVDHLSDEGVVTRVIDGVTHGRFVVLLDPRRIWVATINAQPGDPSTDATAGSQTNRWYPWEVRTFTAAQVDAGRVDLHGADRIVVAAHGAPGEISWGVDPDGIDGRELGQKLHSAGIDAWTVVELNICNAGTEPGHADDEESVAEGVHAVTGATVYAPRAWLRDSEGLYSPGVLQDDYIVHGGGTATEGPIPPHWPGPHVRDSGMLNPWAPPYWRDN